MKKIISNCISLMVSAACSISAFAMEVPTNTTIQDLNGVRQYIKIYTVAPDTDPQSLIDDVFEYDGYTYTYSSMTKEEQSYSEKEHHTETVTADTEKSDLSVVLKALSPSIEYDDGEFRGTLYLDHSTISTVASGYLAERGIVCGEGNGRNVPDAPVTVRQWATMLCRALGDAAPLNYDDDCIRQGYSDGWLEMTAITAPDSDLCRYAIYKSGFAAFGVDLYSLQLYPNEGKLSQQSEVLRAAADFGLCEETCDGTEIITRGEAAELLYALLTKTFAVVPPPMLDNIPLDNKAGVALNNYLLEIQKIPESMMQSFAEKGWQYVIDFDYLAKLSKKYDLGCTGATIYEGRKIIISSAESTIHEFGHFLDGMMGFPSRTKGFYQRESASAASLLRTYALTDAQEYFADCFVYWIKNRGDGKKMAMLQNAAPETYHYFKMLEENDWKPSLSP